MNAPEGREQCGSFPWQVLPDGLQTVYFCNGDVKQTDLNKRVVYYYAEAGTTHVSESDGTQLYHFPNGQVGWDLMTVGLRWDGGLIAVWWSSECGLMSACGWAPSVTCLIWQVERHFIDGLKEITFADGSVKVCAAAPRAPARPDADSAPCANSVLRPFDLTGDPTERRHAEH